MSIKKLVMLSSNEGRDLMSKVKFSSYGGDNNSMHKRYPLVTV